MRRSLSSPVSLPFLPNLSDMEFLGLSFNAPLEEDLDDVEVELLLEGDFEDELELEFLFKSFLLGFPLLPEFLDSKRVSSSCI